MTQAREMTAVAVIEPDPALGAPPLPPADEGVPGHRALRLAVPLILAAGWGALITFSLMFLIEDGGPGAKDADPPERAAAETASLEPAALRPARPQPDHRIIALAASAQTASAQTPPPSPGVVTVANASADLALPGAELAVPAADALPQPASPPEERPDYVGTWGPTLAACGAHSRRRGFLPATITEDGARAGRTECRFRNGRRDGVAWAMAADCSERGRRWTSQVRLVVDGDRLTWTSGKGPAFYVRCGRRDG